MRVASVLPAFLAITMLACGMMTSARANDEPMSAEDFVDTASAMNQGEINAAESAMEQDDASAAVKEFAQQLHRDHRALEDALQGLAEARQLDLSALPDVRSMGNATRLVLLRGETYDREFLEAQVAAHERFIEHMERAGRELEDDELREFANSRLPELREHLNHAKKLLASVSENADPGE